MLSVLFSILLLFLLPEFAVGRTKCVRVVGRLHCPTDWDRHYDVSIKLMDRDYWPWERDDQMAQTRTDEDGNYRIEGCAGDFGSWNDPDPYLLIEHRCPLIGHSISIPFRRKEVDLNRNFLPETIYIESIRIDEEEGSQ
ncbi:Transthyretin-like family-containing protein [Aphelenchoides besseyi]|nr:Transthyretin-like family-containing protein [Aphelenchoides besseyi]KAI6195107.1 Transthyretin-like family-containing protein [Aphelenchoides besseyi]